MLRRLQDLLVFEHRRYQIDPRAALDFARACRLWRDDLPALAGHRECTNTTCPGDAVYRRLDELRLRVAERSGAGPLPTAIVEAPTPRNFWAGTATYQWAGAERSTVSSRGSAGRPMKTSPQRFEAATSWRCQSTW